MSHLLLPYDFVFAPEEKTLLLHFLSPMGIGYIFIFMGKEYQLFRLLLTINYGKRKAKKKQDARGEVYGNPVGKS